MFEDGIKGAQLDDELAVKDLAEVIAERLEVTDENSGMY